MAEPKYYDELPAYIMHSDGEFTDGKFRAVDGSGNSLDISLPVDSEHNAESIVIETSDTKGAISVGYSEEDNQASVTVTGDLNIVIGDKKFRLYLAKVTIAGNTIDSVELSVEDGENNVIALSVPSTTFIMSAITNLINQKVPVNVKDGSGTGAIVEGMVTSATPQAERNIASGVYSHAEGSCYTNGATKYPSTASGEVSHSEGCGCTASGKYSHAEGCNTSATANNSHSENAFTTASGFGSHAEGQYTKATGQLTHAEGSSTTAAGNRSHAEGMNVHANGDNSHGQNEYTIADGKSQTVIGRNNVAQGSASSYTDTDYAFIIGNGASPTNRSNALAVRWDGAIVLADGTVLTVEQLAKVANLT